MLAAGVEAAVWDATGDPSLLFMMFCLIPLVSSRAPGRKKAPPGLSPLVSISGSWSGDNHDVALVVGEGGASGSSVVSVGRRGRAWESLSGLVCGGVWGGAYSACSSSPSTLSSWRVNLSVSVGLLPLEPAELDYSFGSLQTSLGLLGGGLIGAAGRGRLALSVC